MSDEKPKVPIAGQTPTLTAVLALAEEMQRVLGPEATSAASGSVPAWRVPPSSIHDTALRLREAGWDYLIFVTAVDYPAQNRLEMVYALASYADGCHIAIVADVDRAAPAIDTVSDVWAAADWHERETYDMFGVVFRGHPFLRRILLDEEWPGHPLLKDYTDTLHDMVKRPY